MFDFFKALNINHWLKVHCRVDAQTERTVCLESLFRILYYEKCDWTVNVQDVS